MVCDVELEKRLVFYLLQQYLSAFLQIVCIHLSLSFTCQMSYITIRYFNVDPPFLTQIQTLDIIIIIRSRPVWRVLLPGMSCFIAKGQIHWSKFIVFPLKGRELWLELFSRDILKYCTSHQNIVLVPHWPQHDGD